MPCKHTVATMWDTVVNRQEVGIPKSYVNLCYWVTTWKTMYNFKIGLLSGDTNWPKSPCPMTIFSSKASCASGKTKKKRRKMADEISKGMVKGSKWEGLRNSHLQHMQRQWSEQKIMHKSWKCQCWFTIKYKGCNGWFSVSSSWWVRVK